MLGALSLAQLYRDKGGIPRHSIAPFIGINALPIVTLEIQIMPHIALPPDLPGIRGAMAFRPETARPLNALVEVLLTAPTTPPRGERELTEPYVPSRNCTHYCHSIHGAIAAAHLGGDEVLVKQVKTDFTQAPISAKLKALLTIAGKVQQDGKLVTAAVVDAARQQGATDLEIHDTVLIAAAFCMYNRYVDGLGTWAPEPKEAYVETGQMLASVGYVNFRPRR